MAEADPPDARGLHDFCNCLANQGKHLPHTGMVEQHFIVNDEKLIELEIIPGEIGRNPVQVWRNFVYPGFHGQSPPILGTRSVQHIESKPQKYETAKKRRYSGAVNE
jgi:hypothetical protein